ncbi:MULTISPECIES: alpha/beta hydrolase-fold protein [unclassified Novosphingobium]|uniref:alpha/beta hydrolase n=1 Tax=unclassified Novosphingobium TaxID=2644732 RepID=UPI0025F0439F|nr:MULTISPECIES: alpha/beta hydrolase-fold protein [unclassified Novosphingobium]HQV03206.1 alpha/beta hydrolase-fold protein [Novosphingobium sp.]
MIRYLLAALLALVLAAPALAEADRGRLVEVERMAAAGLPDQRLSIWLPPGYDTSKRRYPVLYMHDGHNLFDLKKSNFNKIWAADQAMLAAIASGKVEPHIIVGVWAPGKDRYRQYLPKDIYDLAGPAQRQRMDAMTGGPVISDVYLAWLAGPLKQWVDRTYRTRTGPRDTAIAGSSMGGLMSCYAFLRRPDIYGRAACVSSHWPAADPGAPGAFDRDLAALWDEWFQKNLGKPRGRRLWLDHGTATLDAWYAPYQQVIDARLGQSGWKSGRDWESKVYVGAEHEENAWARRLPEIFTWLLRK